MILTLGSTSIIYGWLPLTIAYGSLMIAFLITFYKSKSRFKHIVVSILVWATCVAAYFLITHGQLWGTDLPINVYYYGALPLLSVFIIGAAWKNSTRLKKYLLVLLIPLLILSGLTSLNKWFGYFPTFESLNDRKPPSLTKFRSKLEAKDASAVIPTDGALISMDFPAIVSNFSHRDSYVWLPPVWFSKPRPKLPVIILLNGVPGEPADFARGTDAARSVNEYASKHNGKAPILIFADGNGSRFNDTECMDSKNGNAETYLTKDVVNGSHKLLGTTSDPSYWAIGGISAGGTCALTLALTHPKLFSIFIDIAGDPAPNLNSEKDTLENLFNNDQERMDKYNPSLILATKKYSHMSAYFCAGHKDTKIVNGLVSTAALARNAGISVFEDYEVKGKHNFLVFKPCVDRALAWTTARLFNKITPPKAK